MADAHEDAREAARDLAKARWGDTKLRSAIATLTERRADLSASHRAQLREIAGDEDTDD